LRNELRYFVLGSLMNFATLDNAPHLRYKYKKQMEATHGQNIHHQSSN